MAKKKNEETTPDGVYVVYCKLPCGYSFPMPDGRKVVLNGSNHKNADDQPLTIVGYGRTEVAVADWEWIAGTYAALKVFDENNPIIFAAEDKASGDAMAKEVGPSVKNGMEQRAPKEIIKQAERQANNPQPKE